MVELVATGRRPSELAKEFGCHETSILSSVRQARAATPSLANLPPTLHESERAELLALRKEVRQMKMERDILAKATAWFANSNATASTLFVTLIAANQAELPVATMCDALQVFKSGYYDWHERAPSKRSTADITLLNQIKEAHAMSDVTYGMPGIRAELADLGVVASRKRIAALMRANAIAGVSRRRGYCVTTARNPKERPAPDLVKRQFVATDINQLWVADMPYIPTWQGFLYLAVVTDVYSRKVVGWAFGARKTADLVVTALKMALFTRKPESVIHHSDQVSQYTSVIFGKRCAQMGARPSMGTVSDAYDNAMAESFFATLECELIDRRSKKTHTEARLAIFTWIEAWYNP